MLLWASIPAPLPQGQIVGKPFEEAGEGTRTLDIQLGKLALYQLSYARMIVDPGNYPFFLGVGKEG